MKDFNVPNAKENYVGLSYDEKLSKVKFIINLLKSKSPFFAEISNLFKSNQKISEEILDYLYDVVMKLVDVQSNDAVIKEGKMKLKEIKVSMGK
ncbi:MAG: hypothetical protein WC872_00705 [Candidatus Absconditabacterales bacterium]